MSDFLCIMLAIIPKDAIIPDLTTEPVLPVKFINNIITIIINIWPNRLRLRNLFIYVTAKIIYTKCDPDTASI